MPFRNDLVFNYLLLVQLDDVLAWEVCAGIWLSFTSNSQGQILNHNIMKLVFLLLALVVVSFTDVSKVRLLTQI